jgi:hypothetical protein
MPDHYLWTNKTIAKLRRGQREITQKKGPPSPLKNWLPISTNSASVRERRLGIMAMVAALSVVKVALTIAKKKQGSKKVVDDLSCLYNDPVTKRCFEPTI